MQTDRPLLGAIADDFTGATDLALTLARAGMSVKQVVGVPAPEMLQGAQAIVVSLKSRTAPVAEAVGQSRQAAEALLAAGARQLFFKYCSTFDSTDEGNIGPVIDDLLEVLGERRTLACPAVPANKRSIYRGHLFVGDQLLSDSPMKDHPLTPMRDANLVRVLARQAKTPVSLIDLMTVRGDGLGAALQALDGVAIVDAIEDSDLMAIGRAAKGLRLVTGGSGVAMGLPANFGIAPKAIVSRPLPAEGRTAILAGSCSAATRRQIAVALQGGLTGLQLDPIAIAEGRQTPDEAMRFAETAGATPVIYASAAPEQVAESQRWLGRDKAGALVEHFLAELASSLVAAGFNRLIIAGGETSGAVVEGLGLASLDIGPEIDPGVPWMYAEHRQKPLAIALKSGNFGADDMFIKAWGKLA